MKGKCIDVDSTSLKHSVTSRNDACLSASTRCHKRLSPILALGFNARSGKSSSAELVFDTFLPRKRGISIHSWIQLVSATGIFSLKNS